MNLQDRQLLGALQQRQLNLEIAVSQLRTDVKEFAVRLETPEIPPYVPPVRSQVSDRYETPVTPPPVPSATKAMPEFPPLPPGYEIPAQMPLPPQPEPLAEALESAKIAPPTPPTVPPVSARPEPASPGLEIQFGRWLARIGVVFALLTLVYFSIVTYRDWLQYAGPWTKLSVLAVASVGLIGGGLRLERRSTNLVVYGRTLAGGGLACLYYTLYGATYVPQLHVITNVYLGGILLLAWSAGVLGLAERRKSELLSIFAISLAYFSSAITPVGDFTMAADLLLAVTAVVFLIRNAWTGLSWLCLLGTYLGFVRQVFAGSLDEPWNFVLVHTHEFWPWAIYLTGAWLIFTAGVFLARAPSFDGGKRLGFLSLNNGAWTGLLVVAAQLSGHGHIGSLLLFVGAALFGAWAIAKFRRADSAELASSYLLQGLAIGTAGIFIAYHGMTRGLLITAESVFLAAAGATSRNPFLRAGAMVTAFVGTATLLHEIFWAVGFPWVAMIAGVTAMLANAWLARYELWHAPREVARTTFVGSSAYYICLSFAPLLVAVCSHAHEGWIGPDLALAALGLAATIYIVPLFELPPLSQLLLLAAQLFAFILPLADGYTSDTRYEFAILSSPQWSQDIVALVTMFFVLWWPRQTRVLKRWWLVPLTFPYSLAMVAFTYNSVHPHVSEQTWMMAAAAFSLVFLAFGAWNRSWPFVGSGQVLLVISVLTFFRPADVTVFPWAWWAALVPIAVVFLTGWAAHQMLAYAFNGDGAMRENLRIVAKIYQSLAILMLARWIFGIVPSDEITLALFALATVLIGGGLLGKSSYFIRAGLVLNVAGCCNYVFAGPDISAHPFTWFDAGAVALFLAQPALLRQWARELVSEEESWMVITVSSLLAWLFVSGSITAAGSHDLTLGWALLALALVILGFAAQERRQRWCGLGLLIAAFVRVGVHDFWRFSDVGKVLTFFALTVICLGLSFLYYKYAERFREWL
jgi:hypothetical protein